MSTAAEPIPAEMVILLDIFRINHDRQVPHAELVNQVTAIQGEAHSMIASLDDLYTAGFVEFGRDPRTGRERRDLYVVTNTGKYAIPENHRMAVARAKRCGLEVDGLKGKRVAATWLTAPGSVTQDSPPDPAPKKLQEPTEGEETEAEPKKSRRSATSRARDAAPPR